MSATPIRYAEGDIEVRPGDEVLMKRWLRKTPGVVVYVPGVSPPRRDFGDEYVREIGVMLGTRIYGVVVMPVDSRVRDSVLFKKRGASIPPIPEALDDC